MSPMGASSRVTTIPYLVSGNYTFDAAEIEIVAGKAQLKDKTPTDATFGATYTTDQSKQNWSKGPVTGTLNGDAAVSGGKLVLIKSAANDTNCEYVMSNEINPIKGTLKFIWIPNYTGSPANDQRLFDYSDSFGSNNNRMFLAHDSAGAMRLTAYTSAGVLSMSAVGFATISPTAGTPIELEYNWDFTVGSENHDLYMDGLQQGSTSSATSVRSDNLTSITALRFGGVDAGTAPDFTIDDPITFSEVQHTAPYTAGYTLPNTKYSIANPSIIIDTGQTADKLETFVATVVEPGSDSVKFSLPDYWDGDSWETSDSTFAKSSTATELNANASTLDVSAGTTFFVRAYLHSDDGSTTPDLDTVLLGYNFHNTQADPATCTIFGFYRNVSGVGVSGASVTMSLKRATGQYREAGDAIIEKPLTITTDADGRFEIDLIKTIEFESNATGTGIYELLIELAASELETNVTTVGNPIEFTVPDATEANITDQITEAA